MFLALGPPGMIFLASAVLLACTAFIWPLSRAVAACVSLPLLVGLTYMLFRYPFGSIREIYGVAFAGCYASIAWAFWNHRRWQVLLVSGVLLAIWFGLHRRFSELIKVRTYQMHWVADGKTPWGTLSYQDGTPIKPNYKGQSLVIVWRPVSDGYCWTGVYSNDLRDRLQRDRENTTVVEYNTLWDFGQYAGSRVKSIDGIGFYDGDKPIRADTNDIGGHHWTAKESILGLCDN